VSREAKGANFVPVQDADSAALCDSQDADSVFSRGMSDARRRTEDKWLGIYLQFV
jgi:hypothetical protein